ncbi:MAG: hypothetical protein DME60_12050 [Verrucomicrobia bacterium]|nr:MAG: hypothetical protein DME60_12050 [Verrucomicrobiota bacterium]
MTTKSLSEEIFNLSCCAAETEEVLKYLAANNVSPLKARELAQRGLSWISPAVNRLEELAEELGRINNRD